MKNSLLKLLRSLEWLPIEDTWLRCPACHGFWDNGHRADCALLEEIRLATEPDDRLWRVGDYGDAYHGYQIVGPIVRAPTAAAALERARTLEGFNEDWHAEEVEVHVLT